MRPVTYDAATRTATLNPSANLAADTQYTARLTGGTSAVRDMANNPLANVTWTFTTAPAPDTTAPTVTRAVPGQRRHRRQPEHNITVTFSEAVNGVSGTHRSPCGPDRHHRNRDRGHRDPRRHHQPVDPRTRRSTLASNTRYTVTVTGGRRHQGRRRQPADQHHHQLELHHRPVDMTWVRGHMP